MIVAVLEVEPGIEVGSVVVISNITIISLYIGWQTRREDPRFALLRRLGLAMGTLLGTDFRGADLTDAAFDRARLTYARFVNATLNGVSWNQAQYLQFARFSGTILADRDVRELLAHGRGSGRAFRGKNLHGACLVEYDLQQIDVRETELIQANLSQADITGAKLYGSARKDWMIDDIRCDYVYWDEAGEERTPINRNFRPGEFEELHKQLPTFEYVFEHGFTPIDATIMGHVVQETNARHDKFKLDLINFDKRGQPHATFTVQHKEQIEEALKEVTAGYETQLQILEGQKDQLMQVVAMLGAGSIRIERVEGNPIIQQVQGNVTGDMAGRDNTTE